VTRLRERDVRHRGIDAGDAARGRGGGDGVRQRARPRSHVEDGVAVAHARERHHQRGDLLAPSAHEAFVGVGFGEHRGLCHER
jgi:hypothetical protein